MKNYLKEIRSTIGSNLNNISGCKINRKVVVIESDDWGSIRMPSKEVYFYLLNSGVPVNECAFSRFDALESENDLTYLFDLLSSHRDKNNNHPIFTANTIMANPDFKMIRESGFQKYYYEPFPETFKNYPEHANSLEIAKQGMTEKVFFPQLHGREHTYVKRWMDYLKEDKKEVKDAFDLNMADVTDPEIRKGQVLNYREALNYESIEELPGQAVVLREAQEMFLDLYDFKSRSFIAPNYTWSPQVEPYLKDIGINYIQSSRGQLLPTGERANKRFIKHYVGEKNSFGQLFLVRNCIFEPAVMPNTDVVSCCLNQVETSFRWNKPAIISSHRLNYIGFIDESNRKRGLKLLNELLTRICKRWPDVEFVNSEQLGDLIMNDMN